ncbi:exodeoxyribonuclease V subunit gamma [Paraburkholderia caballeronis]|uniref:exodeoxyribonuclease V subunit gamma n=1 Tax=Paraburkholderia caballeronis TaxID=416943 RepID=UPI0010E3B4B8|nr:exodeoxyribonuclease V subunit gamma [Paraburkholderia caballeronis]TDV13963.1 DNA helicase/exodeoxyribonuclease V gamma subunit [Paraburkholderia caballeronis]TDV15476.1 DNA helicase/exodeoxyribonuclease V gamma subunit [Paraburkholderia caballeronis]TDV24944.1 DNA helicase/exodeoxyribonuclease V gamma subunit [Paraburkholderia caballeronis]
MSARELPAGLMLVHGNQPERLRDLMVQWITQNPLAPLEKEVILVQSNGIAQWLKLAFAADPADGGCGIAAALEMSLPSRFLWQAYRAVLGADAVPEVSPFDKSRLVWRLMRMLPERLDAPGYEPLRRFMASDDDQRKRFQLAQRVADLFDQYQVYRADWLAAWANGDDVRIDARGARMPLPDDARWQAELWRALLADVEAQSPGAEAGAASGGRAGVHDAFMRAAQQWRERDARPAGLPRRVVVFGISSLPRQSLEVLAALARWTQVLMCVHNPCMHYWADIVADKDLLRAQHARQRRRAGSPAVLDAAQLHLHAQPLLAAWGKQGRDFIGLLDEYDSDDARASYAPQFTRIGQRIDLFDGGDTDTLLRQMQDDIRDLRPEQETSEHWPEVDPSADASIRFHVAHSPQREVEILHDQLLAAFAADPTLRPRDVIVMVPDIEVYTPHIQAVFGLLDRDDWRHIPFSVADRAQRAFDPLIGALDMLLALPQSRITVGDVLDLLEVPALRARFQIDADDVPTLRHWIDGANIRWGLHAAQRASLGLPQADDMLAPNSWLFGLRRMLLGYAAGDRAGPWQGIEPYGEIGGLDAALLGPLMRLIDALDRAWQTLRTPATVDAWCKRLRALKDTFFEAVDGDDAYTLDKLDDALEAWRDACSEAALAGELPLSIVAENWLAELEGSGLSQRFFAGAVTFATLMPMRAIPFRRVCLLGMNDGDYPRSRTPLDFDLMRGDYRPGDRSRREDDRYLFLEALLSARDHLHVSWVGRSVTDNTPRPPSVLVGQLREHLAKGWRLADGDARPAALLDALTVEHRLQPFSADYFPARSDASPLFTYADEWNRPAPQPAAMATAAARLVLPPVARDEPLSVRELAEFLRDPVKAFFRQRLRVAFEAEDAASENHEPFSVDALQTWQLQNELIRAQVAALARGDDDVEPAAFARLERMHRSGDLAAGGFGEVIAEELMEPMADLFERYRAALARWPDLLEGQHEVRIDALLDGRALSVDDWIDDLRANPDGGRGRVILDPGTLVKENRYRGERLVAYWVAHLAAQLAAGDVTTVVVSKVGVVEFAPLSADDAHRHLLALLRAWDDGMRRPLPLAAKTAFAWLRRLPDGMTNAVDAPAEAVDAARAAYEGASRQLGERDTNAYLQRAYPDFDALAASGEFGAFALELLLPLHRAIPAGSKSKGAAKIATPNPAGETA